MTTGFGLSRGEYDVPPKQMDHECLARLQFSREPCDEFFSISDIFENVLRVGKLAESVGYIL
jgi:hypothetical protein